MMWHLDSRMYSTGGIEGDSEYVYRNVHRGTAQNLKASMSQYQEFWREKACFLVPTELLGSYIEAKCPLTLSTALPDWTTLTKILVPPCVGCKGSNDKSQYTITPTQSMQPHHFMLGSSHHFLYDVMTISIKTQPPSFEITNGWPQKCCTSS